ncbi:MAG TPA: hypothetical protein VNN10_09750 [Dehalococcoidia bacterium]|nr:hypothetical protein [Dehalococcoidia bacterium]
MMRDPDRLIDEAERLARRVFDDIEEVLPEVLVMVGALDYEASRSSALFEPIDRETFRVAKGFLRGASTNVVWHRQSSFAARPDSEAFSVAIALLALTEDSVLRLVDAIPVFTKWRDGFYLNRPTAGR